MKNMKYMDLITVFLLISVLVFLSGCGTTSRSFQGETQIGEVADIDDLLGLADEKQENKENKESNDSIAEDDVLKLLGVVEDNSAGVDNPVSNNQQQANVNDPVTQKDETGNIKENTAFNNENAVKEQPSNKTLPEWRATSFSDRYAEARQDYLNRQYREAIQKFEALLSVDTNHTLSDNCQYWIGESYYGLGNYNQAIIAFEKVFSISKSNKDDHAQLKLGLCYDRLGDKARAKIEFQKLIENYPTSEYISSAKRYIESLENQ